MARTSTVHYIAPSAISITPNCNNSANDLAVYIARGTKIKVKSEKIQELAPQDGEYQEWTLAGRNRRLADSGRPYTVYARLPKGDRDGGYLVFVKKTLHDNVWTDAYSCVVNDGNGYSVLYTDGGMDVRVISPDYWYIRLGDVSLPENGQRTVTLDTGILGTDQYNESWNVDPDSLPMRVEIGNSKEAGVPYVGWGESITLDAHLVQGWEDDADDKVHHWTISRDTGDAAADATWNAVDRSATFGQSGQITLQHIFGGTDDMNAAVAPVFTITAWGRNESENENEYVELAQGDITILAETVFSFGLELSAAIVSYNPSAQAYSPAGGVNIRVKCKAQDGTVSYANNALITAAQLHLYHLPVNENPGEDPVPELTFVGGVANLPASVFADGKSRNLWLENGAQVELDRQTVGYVRFGERGDTPVTCYRWYKKGLTPLVPTDVTSEEPAPATGDAAGAENVYPLDKWSRTVPAKPATGDWHLWMCESIHHGSGTIDAWSGPVRVSGEDGAPGTDASDREYIYKRLTVYPFSGKLPANITTDTGGTQRTAEYIATHDDFVPQGWSDTALPAESEKYVYVAIREKAAGNSQQWGAFSTPVLWSNWGVRGTDGDGVEYVFARSDSPTPPQVANNNPHDGTAVTDDDFLPAVSGAKTVSGTSIVTAPYATDDPQGVTQQLPYEWVAKRTKGAPDSGGIRTWNGYTVGAMSMWAKFSENGTPGGNTATVYLYKRSAAAVTTVGITQTLYYKFSTKKLYADAACTTEATTQLGGWSLAIPSGSTDPIYVTAAIAYSTTDADDLGTNEWVAPAQFTDNGAAGAHGINSATVFLYKRSATAVTAHGITTPLYYRFADGRLYTRSGSAYTLATDSDRNNWLLEIPTGNDPCYVIQAAALGTEDYDQIAVADWSSVRKLVKDGEAGNGIATVTSYYKASTSASGETRPSTDPTAGHPVSGWTVDVQNPTANAPYLWSYEKTAYTEGAPTYTDPHVIGHFGSDGAPGTMYQKAYYKSNSDTSPNAPTGDVTSTGTQPGVWTTKMLSADDTYRYVYMCERRSDDGGTTWAWGLVALYCYKPADGSSFYIVGEVDIACATMAELQQYDDGDFGHAAPWGIVVSDITIYEYITSWDDSGVSVSVGDTYRSAHDNHYYQWTGTEWFDLGELRGPQGQQGDNAVQYALIIDPTEINFKTNTVGDAYIDKTVTVTATSQKTDGSTVTDRDSGGYRMWLRKLRVTNASGQEQESWTAWSGAATTGHLSTTVSTAQATQAAWRIGGIEFIIASGTGSSDTIVARKFVPVLLDGRRGNTGATGKMFYSMGEYDSTTIYNRTDELIPMVHYGSTWNPNLGCNGSYYYLREGFTNVQGIAPTGATGNPWEEASDFGVVITQGLFAQFAKLGSFIVSGDYIYSMLGVLVTSSSSSSEATTGTETYIGKPYYVYFSSADPMAENGGPYPKFRPHLVINAKTGEVWFARGNMHIAADGSITVNNATVHGTVYASGGEFTGTVHASDGEFSGTVKASNLYRILAVSQTVTGEADVDHVYLLTPDGQEEWFYITAAAYEEYVTACEGRQGWVIPSEFAAGGYISETHAQELDPLEWSALIEGSSRCVPITYSADVVENMSIGVSAGGTSYTATINLPKCSDFSGKIVEVHNFYRNDSDAQVSLRVRQCDGASVLRFIGGSTILSAETIAPGKQGSFYSTGSQWLFIYSV